jgi:hypothetical protein
MILTQASKAMTVSIEDAVAKSNLMNAMKKDLAKKMASDPNKFRTVEDRLQRADASQKLKEAKIQKLARNELKLQQKFKSFGGKVTYGKFAILDSDEEKIETRVKVSSYTQAVPDTATEKSIPEIEKKNGRTRHNHNPIRNLQKPIERSE